MRGGLVLAAQSFQPRRQRHRPPHHRGRCVHDGTLLAAVGVVASNIVFFSLALWLNRSHALSRWLLDVTITFSLYPEALFSGALKLLPFTVLLAGIVAYRPLHAIREASLPHALALLLLLTGLYLRAAVWVFGAGLNRYPSGSRFGVFG